jgi:hypothetical protein
MKTKIINWVKNATKNTLGLVWAAILLCGVIKFYNDATVVSTYVDHKMQQEFNHMKAYNQALANKGK